MPVGDKLFLLLMVASKLVYTVVGLSQLINNFFLETYNEKVPLFLIMFNIVLTIEMHQIRFTFFLGFLTC